MPKSHVGTDALASMTIAFAECTSYAAHWAIAWRSIRVRPHQTPCMPVTAHYAFAQTAAKVRLRLHEAGAPPMAQKVRQRCRTATDTSACTPPHVPQQATTKDCASLSGNTHGQTSVARLQLPAGLDMSPHMQPIT